MDAEEQKLISSKIESLNLETDITSFLMTELTKPLDVAEIAASADSPEAAAEIYLASAMVVDLSDDQERQYMNSLAKSLGLEAAVVQNLEGQLA